jgi:hypothetical protein
MRRDPIPLTSQADPDAVWRRKPVSGREGEDERVVSRTFQPAYSGLPVRETTYPLHWSDLPNVNTVSVLTPETVSPGLIFGLARRPQPAGDEHNTRQPNRRQHRS